MGPNEGASGSRSAAAAARRPRATLVALRAVAVGHAAAVITQPVLAGLYLSGDFDVLGYHSGNAILVILLGLVQLVATLLYWAAGGGRGWPVSAALLLVVAEVAQAVFGFSRVLALHIPLGVAIVTGTVVFTGWVLGQAAREPRRSRRGLTSGAAA